MPNQNHLDQTEKGGSSEHKPLGLTDFLAQELATKPSDQVAPPKIHFKKESDPPSPSSFDVMPPSLSNGSSYAELIKANPLETVGGTAISLLPAGYLAYKGIPKLWASKGNMTSATVSITAGMYGTGRLFNSDASDLFHSRNVGEGLRYGADVAGDTAMILGAVGRFIPRFRKVAMLSTAIGFAVDKLSDWLAPKKEDPGPVWKPAEGTTQRLAVDAPLTNGQTEARDFNVYLPKGYSPTGKPLPVMYMLNGATGGDTEKTSPLEFGMNTQADQKNFIVVYPAPKIRNAPFSLGAGKLQDWNISAKDGGNLLVSVDPRYNDVDYINSVRRAVESTYNVDKSRESLVGFSSGGRLASIANAETPNTYSSIVSVHGTRFETDPIAQTPTASLFVTSKHDEMLPENGGRGLMTSLFSNVDRSEPLAQIPAALEANKLPNHPTQTYDHGMALSTFSQPGAPPVFFYENQGGPRSGLLGELLGQGRFPTQHAAHAWDGGHYAIKNRGWPVVGAVDPNINISDLVSSFVLEHKLAPQETEKTQEK